MSDPDHHWSEALLQLWWERQRAQWEVWALGANRDLGPLDEQLYLWCREHAANIQREPGRRGEVLRRRTARILADSHPEVADRRNSIDRAFFSAQGETEQAPSRSMRERVLELMDLRDATARDLGFAGYPELVFWDEELDREHVCRLINDLVGSQEGERRAVQTEFGVDSVVVGEGAPNEYWSQLRRIKERLIPELYAPAVPDVRTSARALLQDLGLAEALDRIRIEVRPEPATMVVLECGPADIRLKLDHDASDWCGHELGHALARALNRDVGIYRLLPTSTDEAFGRIFEAIAVALPGMQETLGLDGAEARRAWHYEAIFENARLCASFNFEMGLWQDRSDPERLYRRCYEAAGLGVADESGWPYDSFRSIDPVYVHNYVVGWMLGSATAEHLRHEVSAEPSPAWGRWLVANYYQRGAAESLMQKAQALRDRNPFRLAA